MSDYAQPEVLVSTNWLKENLGKPNLKIVEIDVDTKAYDAGHVRGAIGFNWQTQLQDQVSRDIISKTDFEKLLSQAGISPSDTVILYGDNNNWFAAWALWQFNYYGHKNVKLMNGGRKKWVLENRPLTTEKTSTDKTTYKAKEPDITIRAFRDHVMW